MNDVSKAFVREDADKDEEADDEDGPALPKGRKNYITPGGFKKMKDELHRLLTDERPKLCEVIAWAAGNGDRSENADYTYGKRRLRQIDGRIRFLTKRLEHSEVVDPSKNDADQVYFGATVTVRDEDGGEKTYAIVGVDEIDLAKNRISWISPLASALLKKQLGDVVEFKSPKGVRELEIIDVRYVALD
jgi:transcription elongation factor GreB